ncbi:MAG: peptidase M61 [Bacteroidia bacterium]|nr:peptidase M61 [Bacteroidia bacterium]
MRTIFLALALAACTGHLAAQTAYRYTLDLYQVVDDKVMVTLQVPQGLEGPVAEFVIPKVVPGTYEDYYFGRYIERFEALDAQGNPLRADSIELGTWQISEPSRLSTVRYWVNDSFDDKGEGTHIFEPAGTNIEAGSNFVVNTFGFLGYFEGLREAPFELSLVTQANFFPAAAWPFTASGVPAAPTGPREYRFSYPDYFRLTDTPILVGALDTASFYLGATRIGISVYSRQGKVTAQQIKPTLVRLGQALEQFFGTLPADRYDFLFFFEPVYFGSFGALEHHRCSMYYMPEVTGPVLERYLRDVCAHEFLHILTPLNLHSEEIAYFDFRAPQMSRHLWLYEGCTEYFSHLVQLQAGLYSPDEFLGVMRQKIAGGSRYGEYSFTDNSRNILDPTEHERYGNVYEKGAVIGWVLDLKLRQLSGGALTLKDLLLKLKAAYGPERPFKDEALFAEMARLSGYPELAPWLERYLGTATPLPIDELLATVGYGYVPDGKDSPKGSGRHVIYPRPGATPAQQAAWAAFTGQ